MSVEVSVAQNEFDGDAQNYSVDKICKVSPECVSFFRQPAQSVNTNSAFFTLPVSRNTLLSRRIILEMPITLTVSQSTNTTSGIRHFGSCLRADALNRMITNCQVSINGNVVMSQPYLYSEIVQHYDRDLDELEYGSLQLGPNTPDYRVVENLNVYGQPSTLAISGMALNANTTTLQASTPTVAPTINFAQGLYSFDQNLYSSTTTANTLDDRLYHFKSINATSKVLPSRGAFNYTTNTTVGTGYTVTSGAGNLATTAGTGQYVSKTWTARYCLKNPVLSNNSYDTLANIDSMTIQLNFASDFANRTVLMTVPYYDGAGTPTTTGVTTAVSFATSVSNVFLYGCKYTPNSIDMIPSVQVFPSHTYVSQNDYSYGNITAGTSVTITHPTIRWSQVPEAIFLSVPLDVSARSPYISDYFAQISALQIQINGQSQEYSLYQTKDFYAMCARNGLKLKYQDFDPVVPGSLEGGTAGPGVGMVVLFKPSRDFSGSLKENLNTANFLVDVRYTATNTLAGAYAFVSRVMFITGTTYIIEQGQPIKEITGITEEEYEKALSEGKVVSIVPDELQKEYIGGNFMSTLGKIKNGFKVISKPAAQILTTAANSGVLGKYGDYAQKGADALNTANHLITSMGGSMGSGTLGGGMGKHHMSRSEALRHHGIAL